MSEIPDDMSDEEIKHRLEELRSQVPAVRRKLARKKRLKAAAISSSPPAVESRRDETDVSN